jgi:hypothetical protein
MMKEKRFALIIANNQYEDSGLSRLEAPVQDSEALACVLSNPKIGGFEVQTLINEQSFKVNQKIETFFKECKRDDLLLLYFSGHGIKDETGQLYFATTDTKRKLLNSTAVPARFVNDMMRKSHSRRQVLLLDCCYSGAFARGMTVRANDDIGVGEYFKEGRGQVVLTASDAIQYAFEGDQVKGKGIHSVFTQTLVDGLETGKADIDSDGYVSFDELYDYIREHVGNQMPQQEPRKWAFDVQGEIIIARNPKPVTKPLPLELQQAIDIPLAGVREGAVNELGRLLRSVDKGLKNAALETLKRLTHDDSRRVSTLADEILAMYTESQSVEKIEPGAGHLEAEKKESEQLKPEITVTETKKQERRQLKEIKREIPKEPAGEKDEKAQPPTSRPSSQSIIEPQEPIKRNAIINLVRVIQASKSVYLKWILVTTVGFAAGMVVARLMSNTIFDAIYLYLYYAINIRDYDYIRPYVHMTTIGTIIGILQWIILRRHFSKAGWWIVTSGVGWFVGCLLMLLLNVGDIPMILKCGVIVPLFQWFVMRQHFSKAGWWIFASAAGLVISFPILIMLTMISMVRELSGITHLPIMGIITGAIMGIITGIALVWLLQHPVSRNLNNDYQKYL